MCNNKTVLVLEILRLSLSHQTVKYNFIHELCMYYLNSIHIFLIFRDTLLTICHEISFPLTIQHILGLYLHLQIQKWRHDFFNQSYFVSNTADDTSLYPDFHHGAKEMLGMKDFSWASFHLVDLMVFLLVHPESHNWHLFDLFLSKHSGVRLWNCCFHSVPEARLGERCLGTQHDREIAMKVLDAMYRNRDSNHFVLFQRKTIRKNHQVPQVRHEVSQEQRRR